MKLKDEIVRIKFSIGGTSLRKFFKETKDNSNFVVNISYIHKLSQLTSTFLDEPNWDLTDKLNNSRCLSSIDYQNLPIFKKECDSKELTIAYSFADMSELIKIVFEFKPIAFNFGIDDKYQLSISFPISDYGTCLFCYRYHFINHELK